MDLVSLSSTKHISNRQQRQNHQLHFDQQLELQRILTLNRDKFGTGFGIRDNSASRMTSYFSGQAIKIRDCPEKFGTDGHLTHFGISIVKSVNRGGLHAR